MSHYFNVRVQSVVSGNVIHVRQFGVSRRKARAGARRLARINGMNGRLIVSPMKCEAPSFDCGANNPKPCETLDEAEARIYGSAPELAASFKASGDACENASKALDVYAEAAGSIFPVTVVRVADDPNYARPRFHVRDAKSRTLKNCKTKREADDMAARINNGETVDG